MDDEIVDMTMHDLATRVCLDPELSKTTVVAPLILQSNIEQVFCTGDISAIALPLYGDAQGAEAEDVIFAHSREQESLGTDET